MADHESSMRCPWWCAYQYTQVANDPEVSSAEAPCGRRRNLCLCFLLGLVVITALLPGFNPRSGHSSFVPRESKKDELAKLLRLNLQMRNSTRLSSASNDFVNINMANLERRRRDMQELDEVRLKLCGRIADGNWKFRDNFTGYYMNSSVEYARMSFLARTKNPKAQQQLLAHLKSASRWVCQGEHPRLKNTHVWIERIGPLRSRGGYDWNSFYSQRGFEEITKNRAVYLIGRMFAPVYADGAIIEYPPLHIHHAHVYPFKNEEMEHKNVPKKANNAPSQGRYQSQHHVLLQAHGDSSCKPREGGTACLLAQLPDGQGYRIVNSSGFETNFELNDVRPAGSKELEFYVDIAYIYTFEPKMPTTFLQIGAPILGLGWQTYYFPLDKHTNMLYFKFQNALLGPGEISDYIIHTHMTFLDSLYVFKGANAYHILEKFRKVNQGSLPYIFECHGQHFTETTKSLLRSLNSEAELICEAAKPGLLLSCGDPDVATCELRDRRLNLICKQRVRLEAQAVLVVLAFNRVRRTSTLPMVTRNSGVEELAPITPFGMGFSGHQHTIFRADFVSDRAKRKELLAGTGSADKDLAVGAYAPPSLFSACSLPEGVDAKAMLDSCKANLSFKVDLPWNANR